MRFLLATLVVAGCGFDHGVLPSDGLPDASYGGGGGTPTSDGSPGGAPAPTAPRTCRHPDPSLRLCLELDDGALTPIVHDASSAQLDGTGSGLSPLMRTSSDPAAVVTSGGAITIPERAPLDISDAITIEMWIRPDFYQSASLVRNEGQYVMQITGGGQLGCSLAGAQVYSYTASTNLLPGVWNHVACTFDGSSLKAYINGSSQDCGPASSSISTSGTLGTKIAPGFRGGIDGVRVYARALDGSELCDHAGKTSCQTQCNSD